MPTGYTADVESGELSDFRTFALQCARAFGACITQRDDDMRDPPRQREVGSYHTEALEKARQEYARLMSMPAQQVEREAEADYLRAVKSRDEWLEQNQTVNARYQAMLDQVNAWTPPSSEHRELKKFMAEQLAMSMGHFTPEVPKRRAGEEWLDAKMDQAGRDVEYHRKQLREEQERVEQANLWIAQLYESLEAKPAAVA